MAAFSTCNILLMAILLRGSHSWPPAYSVDLETSEEFVINDQISDEDVTDVYQEEELIQEAERDERNRHKNDKYFNLHQWAEKNAAKEEKRSKFKTEVAPRAAFREHYVDGIEPVPWQAGFVDENGKYMHPDNEKVYYINEMANKQIKRRIEEGTTISGSSGETREDYKNLEAEYEDQVKKEQFAKDVLNFTDTKEEESFKDAVDDIVGGKAKSKNCTEEEKTGIGLTAVKCFYQDMNKSQDGKSKLVGRLTKITVIWVVLYLAIAVPCFCTRGWGCCCFTMCCKCCRPQECIDEAKTYLAVNPLGVRHLEDGNVVKYKPTNYERYSQKRLNKAIMNL